MAGKYRTTQVKLYSGSLIKVYASPRVYEALTEITGDMTIYKGVRLAQVLEAVYLQGRKDGAREAFEATNRAVVQAQDQVPHRLPGRPRKR